MAFTAKWYGLGLKALLNGTTKIGSDTLKCALLSDDYTPDQDTDEKWSDISGDEITGDGYSAGGATLTSVSLVYDDTKHELVYGADDISWEDATITARHAVFYSSTSGYLLSYIDFGEDKGATDVLFTIVLKDGSIGKITLD